MKKKAAKKSVKHSSGRKHSGKKAAKAPAVPKLKLAAIRKQLLEMRDDLDKTVRNQKLSEIAAQDNGDSVDQASQSIEKELLFELSDNERVTLDQIEAALRKIDKKTYGLCEACQTPIKKARLEALPFARYCISCQNTAENATDTSEGPDFRNIGEEPAASREA